MIELLLTAKNWMNENQGVLAVILFFFTVIIGWISGFFSALRKKPKFKIKIIDGPTFSCTYGVGKKHNEYEVHRTGIALYLNITNIGSASASIEHIYIGYHWALKPFSRLWLYYTIGWHWTDYLAISLSDFQSKIVEDIKFYPFLFQRSGISGYSAETFLDIGRSTNGVIYFEQSDSFGGFFPVAINRRVKIKIRVIDSFGGSHCIVSSIPRVMLSEAREYNPAFGKTISQMRGEEDVFDLPTDEHGNLLAPESNSKA